MESTFLFYDIETSGLNPAFDQILSFAGIRTTRDLDVLDRHAFLVRLRKDIIPSPMAFLTHRLSPSQLADGAHEYDTAKKIHALVNRPGTISVGYNTMAFDDEFLRFTFYRNLLDPYTHQYANGCSRQDLFPVITLYRIFKPHVLAWPKTDHKESLRLEDISRENAFQTTGRAHEAMNDVEAVIEVARRLMPETDMWTYCLGFFDKQEDERRAAAMQTVWETGPASAPAPLTLGIQVSAKFGPQANFMAPAVYLGESIPYSRQHIWLPLNQDLGPHVAAGTLPFVIRKRYGDHHIILPALDRFMQKVCPVHKEMMDTNRRLVTEKSGWFRQAVESLIHFRYPAVENLDMDAALYDAGFFTPREKKEIHQFHHARPEDRPGLVSRFRSKRISRMAGRILSRNGMPVNPAAHKVFRHHLAAVFDDEDRLPGIKGYKNENKLNRKQGRAELARLKEAIPDSDPAAATLMKELGSYMETLSV